MVAALKLMADLLGMLRERVEVGRVGEFDGLTTPEEVIEAIREELGDEAAAALAALVKPKPEPA